MSTVNNGIGWVVIAMLLSPLVVTGCMELQKALPEQTKGITHDTATQTEAEKEAGVPAPLWQTLADVLALFGLGGAAIYIRSVKKVANGRQDTLDDRVKWLEEQAIRNQEKEK